MILGSHPAVPPRPPMSPPPVFSPPSPPRTAPGPTAIPARARLAGVSSPQWPPRSGGPPWFRHHNSSSPTPLQPWLYSREPARSKAIGPRTCVRRDGLPTCARHGGGFRSRAATSLAEARRVAHVTHRSPGLGPSRWIAEPGGGARNRGAREA